MGKRSEFVRREKDRYLTPLKAAIPLKRFICPGDTFYEPCAGDGRLIRHLEGFGMKCVGASDIEPMDESIPAKDALELTKEDVAGADYIITNPPWDRRPASGYLLHSLIEHFVSLEKPTWLLFDADWMHNKSSVPYQKYLMDVVSVGRVVWIEGTNMTGKDNCAWYLFDKQKITGYIRFHGR